MGNRQGGKPVIMLTSGGKIEADEVWRTKDGVWYRRNGIVTLLKRGQVKSPLTKRYRQREATETTAPPRHCGFPANLAERGRRHKDPTPFPAHQPDAAVPMRVIFGRMRRENSPSSLAG